MKLLMSVILLILPLGSFAQFAEVHKREYRAVWIATIKGLDWPREEYMGDGAVQRDHLCTLLDSLKAINVNTVLLQTRIRGDVIYPSAIEPFAPVFMGRHGVAPDYDPLAFAIEECHRRGMQLHAWLVTIPLGDVAYVKKHREWALPAQKPEACTRFKGAWYMEPSSPVTAEHLGAVAEEIVARYDVDGIHLDYIRYPENNADYPDEDFYAKNHRGMNKADWRRGNITRLMCTLYARVKAIKPWVCVSAATLGKYDDVARYSSYGWNARHTVCQEAQEWLRMGVVDALFPMLYYADNHFYPFACDWGEHSCARHVIVGMGTYQLHPDEKDWDVKEVMRQLHFVRAHAMLSGVAHFRSQFVTDNVKGVYDRLGYFYSYPALVPSMSWLSDMPPCAPDNFEVTVGKHVTTLTWQGNDSLTYNIYSSDTYPVDIENPINLCQTYLRDSCCIIPTSSVVKPRHYAITAIDRYGNESAPSLWRNCIVLVEAKKQLPLKVARK